MGKIKLEYGTFKNGIPFVRYGNGKKILLVWWGGPGNDVPKGFIFNSIRNGLKPFEKEYMIYLLTRKSGLPEGYTTRDMSNDYAELIREEFDGHVDLIIGISYGGVILQHFITDFPSLSDHFVIAMAAHEISEEGKALDYEFAELLSKGKKSKAYPLIINAIYPKGFKRALFKLFMRIYAIFIKTPKSETYSKDIMIEANAEMTHDSKDALKRIKVPVLIMGGDKDFYFPLEKYKEMATLIPNSILKIYPNKGHDIFEEEQFAEDILNFIKKNNKREN
ncbi:MAG: alpha/beta fold hydrolase [Promethearchaeota archaeon]